MRGNISTILKLLLLLLYVVYVSGAYVQVPLQDVFETRAADRAKTLARSTWTERAQGVLTALGNDTHTYFNSSRKLFELLVPTTADGQRAKIVMRQATAQSKKLIVRGSKLVVQLRATYKRECTKGMRDCFEKATSALLDRVMAVGEHGSSLFSEITEFSIDDEEIVSGDEEDEKYDELDDEDDVDLPKVDEAITITQSEVTLKPQTSHRTLQSFIDTEEPAGDDVVERLMDVGKFAPEVQIVDEVETVTDVNADDEAARFGRIPKSIPKIPETDTNNNPDGTVADEESIDEVAVKAKLKIDQKTIDNFIHEFEPAAEFWNDNVKENENNENIMDEARVGRRPVSVVGEELEDFIDIDEGEGITVDVEDAKNDVRLTDVIRTESPVSGTDVGEGMAEKSNDEYSEDEGTDTEIHRVARGLLSIDEKTEEYDEDDGDEYGRAELGAARRQVLSHPGISTGISADSDSGNSRSQYVTWDEYQQKLHGGGTEEQEEDESEWDEFKRLEHKARMYNAEVRAEEERQRRKKPGKKGPEWNEYGQPVVYATPQPPHEVFDHDFVALLKEDIRSLLIKTQGLVGRKSEEFGELADTVKVLAKAAGTEMKSTGTTYATKMGKAAVKLKDTTADAVKTANTMQKQTREMLKTVHRSGGDMAAAAARYGGQISDSLQFAVKTGMNLKSAAHNFADTAADVGKASYYTAKSATKTAIEVGKIVHSISQKMIEQAEIIAALANEQARSISTQISKAPTNTPGPYTNAKGSKQEKRSFFMDVLRFGIWKLRQKIGNRWGTLLFAIILMGALAHAHALYGNSPSKRLRLIKSASAYFGSTYRTDGDRRSRRKDKSSSKKKNKSSSKSKSKDKFSKKERKRRRKRMKRLGMIPNGETDGEDESMTESEVSDVTGDTDRSESGTGASIHDNRNGNGYDDGIRKSIIVVETEEEPHSEDNDGYHGYGGRYDAYDDHHDEGYDSRNEVVHLADMRTDIESMGETEEEDQETEHEGEARTQPRRSPSPVKENRTKNSPEKKKTSEQFYEWTSKFASDTPNSNYARV